MMDRLLSLTALFDTWKLQKKEEESEIESRNWFKVLNFLLPEFSQPVTQCLPMPNHTNRVDGTSIGEKIPRYKERRRQSRMIDREKNWFDLLLRLPLHQMRSVSLAQTEGGGQVAGEVGGGFDGCEEGLVSLLLVGEAAFWERFLL